LRIVPTGINKLLRKLGAKRESLLQGYDDETLHKFRVALRRLRSLLKMLDGSEAHGLRRDLGDIAGKTNAARDWDTLVERARTSLAPPAFEEVRLSLEAGQFTSHRQVLDMLRSAEWSGVMADLKKFVEDEGADIADRAQEATDLSLATRHVKRAWRKAQSKHDTKRWHKLRVAIKELRYSFDSVPKDDRDAAIVQLLEECKRLQEYLGTWHDTVVHQRMLREYVDSLDRESEADLIAVLEGWCLQMEHEGQHCLDQARARLQGKGSALLG
jgi:CHAD domain-containing protein